MSDYTPTDDANGPQTETSCVCGVCRRPCEPYEATCPACLGGIRADMHASVNLRAALLDEATERGTIGEAALLGAPAADPWVWRERRRNDEPDHVGDRLGERDPAWVLGFWSLLVLEWLGIPRKDWPWVDSAERAAGYLVGQLTELSRDHDFPMTAMRDEVRACVAHLEGVLREGARDESTRIHCIEDGCDGTIARLDLPAIGLSDTWFCQRDRKHTYDRGRLNRALHQQLHSEGADRWVTVAQARQVIPRPEQTLRAWIRTGEVPAVCTLDSRQILVWWPDVRAKHIETQTRKRSVA